MELVCPVRAVPPLAAVYHRYSPFVPPEALSVSEDELQDAAPVETGATGVLLMVAITGDRRLSHVPLLIAT